MGKADLHIHTDEGDGCDGIEAIFDYVEHETDLDVIAITEHDSLEVALRARDVWARGRYRFDFVSGVEVTTLEGHVIALYVEKPLPSFRHVEQTVETVHAQGGVCFVPHPLSWLTRSIGVAGFARVSAAGLAFDAVELATANPTARLFINRAHKLNESLGLPVVGASDAHFVQAIGSAYTRFAGTTSADLRNAFDKRIVMGEAGSFPALRSIGLLRAARVPLAGLGATPRRLGWRRTVWSFVDRYFA